MAGNEFNESHVIVNIDDLFTSTIGKPSYLSFQDGIHEKENIETHLICKIESTSTEDRKDYEPNVFSIGPYHNGKLATKSMQITKYECLDYILKMNQDKKLEDYLKVIKEMETRIRSYYRDDIEMDTNNFTKMLLLDACFIILVLGRAKENFPPMSDMPNEGAKLKVYENMGETIIDIEASEVYESQQNIQIKQGDVVDQDDPRHIRMLDYSLFPSDIFLLENQIPFFVIAKIYEIAYHGNNKASYLIEDIMKHIESMIESNPKSLTTFEPKEFHHLLHMCHMYLKPSKIPFQSSKSLDHESFHWHRATEYSKVGICFKKKEFVSDNPHSLLDIEFCNGLMEIPCFTIHDSTRCLFRNLIAFEQRCPQIGNYVATYVIFWSRFISMPDDVALLTKKGILVNLLNSDAEVCDVFTKLAEDVLFAFHGACYLSSTYSEMEAYYRNNKPRLMSRFGSIISNLHHFNPQNPFNHV